MLSILLVQDLHPLGSFKQLTVPSLAMCVLDDVGVCACVFQIRLRFSFYSPFYCCISQFIISFFFFAIINFNDLLRRPAVFRSFFFFLQTVNAVVTKEKHRFTHHAAISNRTVCSSSHCLLLKVPSNKSRKTVIDRNGCVGWSIFFLWI